MSGAPMRGALNRSSVVRSPPPAEFGRSRTERAPADSARSGWLAYPAPSRSPITWRAVAAITRFASR